MLLFSVAASLFTCKCMFTFAASQTNCLLFHRNISKTGVPKIYRDQTCSEIFFFLKFLHCCTYFHADWAVRAVWSSAHWGVDPCSPYFPRALPVPAQPALPKAHPGISKQCTQLKWGNCRAGSLLK